MQLAMKIDEKLKYIASSGAESLGTRKSSDLMTRSPRILAVFTGQGAQWAGMGVSLIKSSNAAQSLLRMLEERLAQLPEEYRPSWSLTTELLKEPGTSQVNDADPTGIVGHSSGEIAALYAAEVVNAEDAICIAYFRGLFTHLAVGADGQPGAMMAVGTSEEGDQELLDEPEFRGVVSIAAVNSSSSVTLSGDVERIEAPRTTSQDEKKFVAQSLT
ncbi:acyl transferase/acyl hydrolase/lysophospholipase [Stachybotrys elegans]|uniref:Acyl transferase/acyl hydrolase/lysophospholipase n=1 Tax=Stachybotrys elegans TaxID=80388 RepID=A0A8K0SB49_9HYPO|nr:acyl transferase/acyl hydrolase/lysophospholipase [Stachybotrys elegans]